MRQWPIRCPSLLFPLSFCGSDEASGCSRYYFQTSHEDSQGVLNEDDYLLQEILFNPRTPAQVEGIRTELNELLDIINKKDAAGMRAYLSKIREKIK